MHSTLELITLGAETRPIPIVRFHQEQRAQLFEIYGNIGNSVTTSKVGAEKPKNGNGM